MAKGGDVEHYCGSKNPHDMDCQYYAEGTPDEPVAPAPEPSSLPGPTFEQTTPVAGAGPTWDETKPAEEEPTWENTTGQYDTTGQKILTGIEGAAQGFAGPLATAAELGLSKLGVPNVSSEDINARQAANPVSHGVGEVAGLGAMFIPGVGQAGLIGKLSLLGKLGEAAKLAKVAEEASLGAKVGAKALNGALQAGVFQTSDEASKLMLGQGDPKDAVGAKMADSAANILYSLGGGGIFGAATGAATGALSRAAESKIGTQVHSFLSGLGETANGIAPENSYARYLDEKSYENGVKAWGKVVNVATGAGATTKAAYDLYKAKETGDYEKGAHDIATDLLYGIGLKYAGGYALKKLSKPAGAAIIKMISNGEQNPRSLFEGMNYADQVSSGTKKIAKSVENLFTAGGQQLFNNDDLEKKREKLNDYIQSGEPTQDIKQSMYDLNAPTDVPAFAKGGPVIAPEPEPATDPIAVHYPEQNLMLSAAKGRISGYLNNLRPHNLSPKLAFDDHPDQTTQKKSYDRALNIAVSPLSVLDEIKKGTLEPEHVKHLNNMYPELNGLLQKKLTERISQAQMDGEKPSYKVRQGLSMFMGTALSGELSPQNMQAAQATFQQKPSQQPPKKTAELSKSSQTYLTGNQAAAERQQKQ